MSVLVFFFNDPATTEIYTLSLHDALPICRLRRPVHPRRRRSRRRHSRNVSGERSQAGRRPDAPPSPFAARSEEHTSELQSRQYLVCRLLLAKKQKLCQNL